MNRVELLSFLRRHKLAVEATVSDSGLQAAVVGIAASDELEIVFDTDSSARKIQNLRRDSRIALVIGWDDEQTVQIQGIADEPTGATLERLKGVYFSSHPAGIDQSSKDITYVRVRPTWARYSDLRAGGQVEEISEAELRSADTRSTRVSRHVNASRAVVYHALLDAEAVAKWMVPKGMTSKVHDYDTRAGGVFRISLTYDAPGATGKTSAHTDTHHGRFVRLVANQEVVETLEFETDDPAMRGEMTVTITLADEERGTRIVAVHDNLPPGVSMSDNEIGWRMSLENLAMLVQTDPPKKIQRQTGRTRLV